MIDLSEECFFLFWSDFSEQIKPTSFFLHTIKFQCPNFSTIFGWKKGVQEGGLRGTMFRPSSSRFLRSYGAFLSTAARHTAAPSFSRAISTSAPSGEQSSSAFIIIIIIIIIIIFVIIIRIIIIVDVLAFFVSWVSFLFLVLDPCLDDRFCSC
jgi:hypothetical protein